MRTHVTRSTPLDPGVDKRFSAVEEMMSKYVKDRVIQAADLRNLDAEVNGGALVEIARILGKPVYMRVNHHDPELARHELAEMQSLIKDVVFPDDDYHQDRVFSVEEYAKRKHVTKQTVWRWIHTHKIQASKYGKRYWIKEQ